MQSFKKYVLDSMIYTTSICSMIFLVDRINGIHGDIPLSILVVCLVSFLVMVVAAFALREDYEKRDMGTWMTIFSLNALWVLLLNTVSHIVLRMQGMIYSFAHLLVEDIVPLAFLLFLVWGVKVRFDHLPKPNTHDGELPEDLTQRN